MTALRNPATLYPDRLDLLAKMRGRCL